MQETQQRRHSPRSAFRSAGWVVVLAVVFTVPALTIDFFHIEEDGIAEDNCPACQLHQSATASGTAAAPELPPPAVGFSQEAPERTNVAIIVGVAAASRSPPPA